MTGITEACFCGRTGDISDREPEGTAGRPALRCPRCAHVDTLAWLPVRGREEVWQEAVDRRRPAARPALTDAA